MDSRKRVLFPLKKVLNVGRQEEGSEHVHSVYSLRLNVALKEQREFNSSVFSKS